MSGALNRALASLAIVLASAGCRNASPTDPSPPAVAPVTVSLTVAEPARMSVSAPVPCPGDLDSCPSGRQEQGPLMLTPAFVQLHTLQPGAYRITGILEATTPAGATVNVQLGLDAQQPAGAGVAREAPHAGAVAHEGKLEGLPEIAPLLCGARFFNPSGAFEWSLMFRVVESPAAAEAVCGG